MNQIVTTGIILSRRDFGEADRILTLLTPDQGKVTLIAKGVRKSKSKLAGGIELFSESNISFIRGRGEIGTLISTRLIKHFGNIVENLERSMLGYELLKIIDKNTETQNLDDYYLLVKNAFKALSEPELDIRVLQLWFYMRLMFISGHQPDLQKDTSGQILSANQGYTFDFDNSRFSPSASDRYNASHIKLLRLGAQLENPLKLQNIKGFEKVVGECLQLVKSIVKYALS